MTYVMLPYSVALILFKETYVPIKSPALVAMETEFMVSLLSLDYLKASQPYSLVQGWYDVLSVPFGDRAGNGNVILQFKWSKPNCTECAAEGKRCRLKSNGTKSEIECVHQKKTK